MATTRQAPLTAPAALAWETPELIDLGSADEVESGDGAVSDGATFASVS
jgi:hypothetical protein